MAAGNMIRRIGTPIRNIDMLPAAKIAPTMPPPTTSFEALI
jgi:hypothetical protein